MEKSHGTIVVKIKPLRQVSDTTRKQLNLLNKNKLNKDHHGSVYFTYSLYMAIKHAELCHITGLTKIRIYTFIL